MTRKAPAHYQSPDQDQARLNREVTDSLAHLLGRAGVDYDIVSVDLPGAGNSTRVPHRLGRDHLGWMVVDIEVHTQVRRTSAAGEPLHVEAPTAVTVKILVF